MPVLPYMLSEPDQPTTAAVFASPHSGRHYPWSFIRDSQLDEVTIRSSEDAFVDRLFESVPRQGATLLAAEVPRAFVDLNRAPDELDPALIAGVRQKGHNARISSGLGVIPRVVAGAREIRQGKISLTEARSRLERYYHPYHAKLADLMERNHRLFGRAILFDCHSMPHEAITSTAYAYGRPPDIVLGDRFGATASPDLTEAVETVFRDAGLTVSRNLPFAGAHVVQTYGKPALERHAIQIEIDRALYLDEANIRPNDNFDALQATLEKVVARLVVLGREALPLAAQ